MSAAETGQATRRWVGIAEALQAPESPGITVGNWTLRWVGDCWSVGRWKSDKKRLRWREATWYGRIDQALAKLLSHNLEGDVSELRELAERVNHAYREVVRTVQEVRRGDQS